MLNQEQKELLFRLACKEISIVAEFLGDEIRFCQESSFKKKIVGRFCTSKNQYKMYGVPLTNSYLIGYLSTHLGYENINVTYESDEPKNFNWTFPY